MGRVVGTPRTHPTTHAATRDAAPSAAEWPSGLNRPRGVRVEGTAGRKAARSFPYLRSFWPGHPDGLKAIRGKCWIGSRSRRPKGLLDVSDLECLG